MIRDLSMPTRRNRPLCVAALASLAILSGCGSDSGTPTTPTPVAGALTATLATPNSNDGALLFTVSGGRVDSVTAGDARLVSTALGAAGATSALVMGTLANGSVVARVWVPDVSAASQYSVSIGQVAARKTYVLQSLTGYRITLVQH
jgi:hypothetical protein